MTELAHFQAPETPPPPKKPTDDKVRKDSGIEAVKVVKPPIDKKLSVIQESADMKESVQALETITERLRKGSTISEVQTAFEAHEFPALERKTSQMALLAAVERSSKDAVNVQEIIKTEEVETAKSEPDIPKQVKQEMRKKSLAQIGLNVFMATAIKDIQRGDEIISSLHLDDFAEAKAEKQYAKMILQSTSELDIAQVLFMLMRNFD